MINSNVIKYLCIDLDGTLLTSSKVIDNDTISCLNNCLSKGLKIVLVSGRHFCEILPYIKMLNLNSNDYVISCDGEYIYTCDGRVLWSSDRLSYNNLIHLWNLLNVNSFTVITNKSNILIERSHVSRLRAQIIKIITKSDDLIFSPKSKLLRKIDAIEKVVISNNELDICDEIQQGYCVHRLEEGRIEILPQNVNKYKALLMLEKICGVNLEQSIYFGNDMNDIECFENMINTVAMKDAPDVITRKASYVTSSCDDWGVFKALNHIFF